MERGELPQSSCARRVVGHARLLDRLEFYPPFRFSSWWFGAVYRSSSLHSISWRHINSLFGDSLVMCRPTFTMSWTLRLKKTKEDEKPEWRRRDYRPCVPSSSSSAPSLGYKNRWELQSSSPFAYVICQEFPLQLLGDQYFSQSRRPSSQLRKSS